MRGREEQDDKVREVQAVQLFLEKPDAFMLKECSNCGGQFLTTYKFVADCSNRCRIKSLAKIGIVWSPYRSPDERWRRAQIPIEYSIPPEALKILIELAVEQQNHSPEQSYSDIQTDSDLLPDESIDPEILDSLES